MGFFCYLYLNVIWIFVSTYYFYKRENKDVFAIKTIYNYEEILDFSMA